MKIVISQTKDVEQLRRRNTRHLITGIELAGGSLDEASTAEAEAAIKIIQRQLHACGCVPAAICVVAAMALAGVLHAAGMLATPTGHLPALLVALGVLCASAVVGKIGGLLYAELALRRHIGRVEKLLSHRVEGRF